MSLSRFNELNYGHFITSRTFKNKSIFCDDNCCQILLEDLDYYREKLGFKLLGYVIMPDHLHCIVYWDTEKYPKLTISKIMQQFKSRVAREIIDDLKKTNHKLLYSLRVESEPLLGFRIYNARSRGSELPVSWFKRSKYRIWQSDFYDFNIYSEKKLREKLNYIHYNPVQAGLCRNPEDYQWSSYKF